jgi:alpha/beta superfamily hydrolase
VRWFTNKTEKVAFRSGPLQLEGIIYFPKKIGPLPAVVVCHPHPQYGGSMDNNVVDGICDSLIATDIIAFKFNFRGVGESEGSFDNGRGETDDVRAAADYLSNRKEADIARLGLAGYSAGSAWGLSAACIDKKIKALAAVSPPITIFNFDCLRACTKPKLMISGNDDHLIPSTPFLSFCRHLPEPQECYLIEGADHIWQGFEKELGLKISSFFKTHL